MYDVKKIQEGAVLGAIYGLLLMLTLFVPGSELVTIFLMPIPFVIYTTHHGYKSTLVLGVIVTLLSFLIAFVISVPLTILAVLGGTMIGQAIHKKRHAYETWAMGTVGVTIGLVTLFVLIQLITQINLVDHYQELVEESMVTSQTMLTSIGMDISPEEINLIEEEMKNIINLLPSILVIFAIAITFVTQWTSYKLLNWKESKNLKFPPFRMLQLPKTIIWIYLITIMFTWFQLDPTSNLAFSVMNVTNLIGILMGLQGISFVLFYFYHKRSSVAVPIIIIIFSIVFLPVGLYMLRIIGIIDIGFGLRERLGNKK
ncbi:membrane protein [Paraliobacillus quinghaiensis]|uniref:Membrane protein n=1 Tax=Paraliobacillus quinghaiensis TaxID=470815 RepID=A0A917TN00_9BACI|nr:YybS family protein [Paraliobacillus quinghaiensis]GGM28455.1 membrane protein [Paraliobacillus quinghaiensis]